APLPPMLPGILRPFERADLAPVPSGWRVGPPDFVAIGCGRAGSTWWWNLIEHHPAVVPNRLGQKELHYFAHFGWDGPDADAIATYREAFAAPEGAVCGDGTFNYLYHPLAIQHLWCAAPETKLFAILRNPVDRMVSNYDMFLRRRLRWLRLDAERERVTRTFSLWDEAVTACRLADGFRAVLKRWPRERLLVLQYERCCQDPLGELARTYRFLGVDERFVPRDWQRPVNRERHELRAPDAAARVRLAEQFEGDVDALCALLPELDRTLWRDFR
ncbi:MAG: sulfotransferase, partial [Planctomycetes bacterium]|nr:sulfotransferase [Planctomycetota bacterium]